MTGLIILTGLLFVLAGGAIVADLILPHMRSIDDCSESLPMFWMEGCEDE